MMTPHRPPLVLVVLALALGSCWAEQGRAQPPESGMPVPRLFSLVPNGAKAGSTIEATFTGQDVEEPEGLLFSDPRIKAERIIPPPPPPPPPADPKKPAAKPAPPDPKKPAPKPAPPPVTKFKVTVPGDVPPGFHDVRLVNKWGVSNPRAFVVGDLPEIVEKEPNDDVPQAQRVELNRTINGVIAAPADVDYFVFAGKAGQRVVISCLASSIDSKLLAALELYDSAGQRLAFNRHYHDNDALVDCTLPGNGDYYVRVHEFTHTQGGPDHFYRLTISTAPWIDAIYPPMVEPGKPAKVTVYGRNLPGGLLDPTAVDNDVVLEKLTVEVIPPGDSLSLQRLAYHGRTSPSSSSLDGFEFRLRNAAGTSNPFLLTFARGPVVLDNDANDTSQTAQHITVPCEIAGRIERRRDRDWYQFSAKKGEVYTIEVFSDRLGAETDMYFVLRNADTKQELAALDDNGDVLTPIEFYTRTEDPPAYRFATPADGKYELLVASRDADSRAGPRNFYRVRITPEQQDFRFVVLPADRLRPDGCCLHRGGEQQYIVLVWRLDGWNGPITLSVEGLPAGVTCPPQVVGPNQRQTMLVLSAASSAPLFSGEIRVKGTGVIQGQTVVREARPASITWAVPAGQGIPAVSRLDRSLALAVRDKAPFRLVAAAERTAAAQGSKVNLALKLSRLLPDFKAALQASPEALPPGISVNNNQPVAMNPGKDEAGAVLDIKPDVPPGEYNIVLVGTAQVPFSKDPAAKQKPNIPVILPATPIVLTVVPRLVANVTVNNPNPAVKAGASAEVVVKVARLHDFKGEFRIQFVLPANLKGVSAADVIIPAGKDEAKLLVTAAGDAVPGNRPKVLLRALATIHEDIPLTHETTINVNVVK
jgi:hypothetical protein